MKPLVTMRPGYTVPPTGRADREAERDHEREREREEGSRVSWLLT